MKPLVLWCRWHDAKLRLAGRSPEAVWGELDFWKEKRREQFRYELHTHILTFGTSPSANSIILDDAGVEKK